MLDDMRATVVLVVLGTVLLIGVQADTLGYCNALLPQSRNYCQKVVKDRTLVDSYCNVGAWESADISTCELSVTSH
jgi:UPF0716 family protein affecting phage T7 exclusion